MTPNGENAVSVGDSENVSVPPAWAADHEPPDPALYTEAELFVGGAISTLPPFSSHHPAWALPHARQALDALSEWEPSDG
jgi:hypothetical protein